ncbi:hypothetical protein [Wukongibacter baidiensis]
MKKCLKLLLEEEKGAIISSEYLLLAMAVLGACYTIYTTISSPLKELHSGAVENITAISRGY